MDKIPKPKHIGAHDVTMPDGTVITSDIPLDDLRPDIRDLVLSQPGRYRVLRNGAVLDDMTPRGVGAGQHGTLVASDSRFNPATITSKTSQEMHQKRREATRRAIQAGIAEGAAAPNSIEGTRAMATVLTKQVMSGHNRSHEIFRTLLTGAGTWQDDKDTGNGEAGIMFTGSLANRLLDILDRRIE
jgi:hypothetical protein